MPAVSGDLASLSVDVATYVAAVAAGVSVNGFTAAAQALVERVRQKLPPDDVECGDLLAVTPEVVAAVDALLREDGELRREAEAVMGRASIDRSIVIRAEHVSGVTQHNY
jgi:hypothetical protein